MARPVRRRRPQEARTKHPRSHTGIVEQRAIRLAGNGALPYRSPVAKRTFDVTVTLLLTPCALAVVVVSAITLAVELRGNPFFVQERIGLRGKPFRMYKLRTMRHAARGEGGDRTVQDFTTFVFSPPDVVDPRVTRFGGFARKTSIDELPNLLNVLLGQMSLVGPRPEVPEIVAQYPPEYHRRHDVLPGIAGLAQVEGRSDLAYDAIINYDLAYVDNHSFGVDLRILWKTAVVVVTGNGAR
jgi:lipopolysaccharide/colanic/teichoic acid biosynthesis glycosyltransferase